MTKQQQKRLLILEISRNVSDMIHYKIMIENGEYDNEPFSNLHEAQSRFEKNLLQLTED